jgi:hypothetical protein
MLQSLAKTVELLISISAIGVEKTYEKIKEFAPKYIEWLSITTFLWLFTILGFAILKAITGNAFFGFMFMFSALVFTLCIVVFWAPLGILIGMISGQTINPSKAGERYVKFVITLFFFELIASIYIMRVPMHHNIGNIPILLASVLAVILGSSIWGGWLPGRFYVFSASVMMMLATASFFLPKTFSAVSNKVGDIDKSIAELVSDSTKTEKQQDGKPPATIISSPSASTSKPSSSVLDEVRSRKINNYSFDIVKNQPTNWIHIPPGASFNWSYSGSDDIEFEFDNGKSIIIRNGEHRTLGVLPSNNLRVKGSSGKIQITIQDDKSSSTTLDGERYGDNQTTMSPSKTVVRDIRPDKWSEEVQLTPGARFRVRAPEGVLKYLFRNGHVISVYNKNDEDSELGTIPDTVFRISGPVGQARVFIY